MVTEVSAEARGRTEPKTLVPDVSRSPYYIFAPRYIEHSAGVRVLHLLCHWLNRMGERSFIVPLQHDGRLTNPDLLTPLLTQEIVSLHASRSAMPVVVYPEMVRGNRLDASCIVRYVLNVPGHLGGDRQYPPEEMVWAYSEQLAGLCDRCDGVLHMPVVDQNVFNPIAGTERSGAVFYAAKFQSDHGQKVFGLPDGAVEITRGQPDSQTPQEIARLLQGAEVFYCFENTALAIEAVLCGCPAVFMPNPYLDKPISLNELGWDGFAWGNDPAEIERARATIAQGQANYGRTVSAFFTQLLKFIDATQAKAKKISEAGLRSGERSFVTERLSGSPTTISLLNSRQVAEDIRSRKSWHFHEWFRIVRALNRVAARTIKEKIRKWLLGGRNDS